MSHTDERSEARQYGTTSPSREDAFPEKSSPESSDPNPPITSSTRAKVPASEKALAWLNALVLLAASMVGIVSFLFPFITPPAYSTQEITTHGSAHSSDAPLLLIIMIVLCLGAILSNLQSRKMNSKIVAVLGILTAINSVLRAVPGPAGFAAVFMLPILCGYAYGATFGFLLGALSLLVSALLGAGVGPWLPFQMFTAGWVGMTSAWLPKMKPWPRVEVAILATWGILWGLLFGALMNIWFWPYVYQAQDAGMYWQPDSGLLESLKRYALFYATTSLWWDLGRAGGNFLLILLFGTPVLRTLRRFGQRFRFEAI